MRRMLHDASTLLAHPCRGGSTRGASSCLVQGIVVADALLNMPYKGRSPGVGSSLRVP